MEISDHGIFASPHGIRRGEVTQVRPKLIAKL